MTEGVFLYYLPGVRRENVTAEMLEQNPFLCAPFFDLIHSPRLLKSRLIGCNVLNAGPDNGAGCIIGVQPEVDTDQLPHHNPESQTWRKFGEQWIGWQTDMLPGPESLRRGKQFEGYEVELGDGRVWIAPVLREFDSKATAWASVLPSTWGVGDDMTLCVKPLRQYVTAWEMAGQIMGTVFYGQSATKAEAFEWAVKCLGLNYRVGAMEMTLLESMTDDGIKQVLHAAVDVPKVDGFEKEAGNPKNP